MDTLFGLRKGLILATVVLLCAGDLSSIDPTGCCTYGKLGENDVIRPNCSNVCIMEHGVAFSSCSADTTKRLIGSTIMAKSVELRNCNGLAAFPKLTILAPSDDKPAILLENCDFKDEKSFEALQEIYLENQMKRCTGTWKDIVSLRNATLPPAVYDRLKELAEKALDGCNADENYVDPGYDIDLFRPVYPNMTIIGRIGLIIIERTHILYLVSFISCSTITLLAVTALVVYLTYQAMKHRDIMAEVEVTSILHSAYGFFRAHGENAYLSVQRIDRLRYDHEFRSLKLHSYAKFIPWMSNAQEPEDVQKHKAMDAAILEVCKDAVEEIEGRVVASDPERTYAARLRKAIGEVFNGVENIFGVTMDLRNEAHNSGIFVRNAIAEEVAKRKAGGVAPASQESRQAAGAEASKLRLNKAEKKVVEILNKPPVSDEFYPAFKDNAPIPELLKSVPDVVKDDEDELAELSCILAKDLEVFVTLQDKTLGNEFEAQEVSKKRFEREKTTKKHYSHVLDRMKADSQPINPMLMPPIARESRNAVLSERAIRDSMGGEYIVPRSDSSSDVSIGFGDEEAPGMTVGKGETFEQFQQRLNEYQHAKQEEFKLNSIAIADMPEDKAVDAVIELAKNETKEQRQKREHAEVKALNETAAREFAENQQALKELLERKKRGQPAKVGKQEPKEGKKKEKKEAKEPNKKAKQEEKKGAKKGAEVAAKPVTQVATSKTVSAVPAKAKKPTKP